MSRLHWNGRLSSRLPIVALACALATPAVLAEPSVARLWNEELLDAIRIDRPKPPVHARNLYHLSVAMWDAWAAYDPLAQGVIFTEKLTAPDVEAARAEAISFAAYRLLRHRFPGGGFDNDGQPCQPGAEAALARFDARMDALGYDRSFASTDGDAPAAVGNRIGQAVIDFGLTDGANEGFDLCYPDDSGYFPINPELIFKLPGTVLDNPNHWQPLAFDFLVLQNGIIIGAAVQSFVGVDWADVTPFGLSDDDLAMPNPVDCVPAPSSGLPHVDPGCPPQLGGVGDEQVKEAMVELIRFSGSVDPGSSFPIDISPGALGNNSLGADDGTGRPLNPVTSQPYAPNVVPYADWARVIAEFWADGPNSETPPGHWNTLANYVTNQLELGGGDPGNGDDGDGDGDGDDETSDESWDDGGWDRWGDEGGDDEGGDDEGGDDEGTDDEGADDTGGEPAGGKRFQGTGPVLSDLEWDVKLYLAVNGAVHDAAIGAWGAKHYYDSSRPISLIRYMGGLGQSSDPNGPSYDPLGLPLVDDLIEVITDETAAPGGRHEHLAAFCEGGGPNFGKPCSSDADCPDDGPFDSVCETAVGQIAIRAWRGGPADPTTELGGVGWIRATQWRPYQKSTFVTPPFPGYISGHSTFSRAAAEVLTEFTGNPYFPGGLGTYVAEQNDYLQFEIGPSQTVELQWATYFDASDEAGISRRYGGIHPDYDDFPGRIAGATIGQKAFAKALTYYQPQSATVCCVLRGRFGAKGTQEIDAAALPQHLAHGDALGVCDSTDDGDRGRHRGHGGWSRSRR